MTLEELAKIREEMKDILSVRLTGHNATLLEESGVDKNQAK